MTEWKAQGTISHFDGHAGGTIGKYPDGEECTTIKDSTGNWWLFINNEHVGKDGQIVEVKVDVTRTQL